MASTDIPEKAFSVQEQVINHIRKSKARSHLTLSQIDIIGNRGGESGRRGSVYKRDDAGSARFSPGGGPSEELDMEIRR